MKELLVGLKTRPEKQKRKSELNRYLCVSEGHRQMLILAKTPHLAVKKYAILRSIHDIRTIKCQFQLPFFI